MMTETALALPSFTIDASITEWLAQKRTTRSGSAKTNEAYQDTIASFRSFLTPFGLDLLANPIDIARRNVQAYAEVLPIEPEVIETGLESISRNRLQGLRNYALLAGRGACYRAQGERISRIVW